MEDKAARLQLPPFDQRLGIQFPAAIGPFAFERFTVFDDPAHGVSYLYKLGSSEANATVYVYDFGVKDLPEDVKNIAVLKAFAEVLQGVLLQAPAAGRRVAEFDNKAALRTNAATGREYLFNHHIMQEGQHHIGGVATLATYNRHFVKVRLSYLADNVLARQMSEIFVYGIHHVVFTGGIGTLPTVA